jgi:undecaprenyl-diphosphatase
VTIFQAVFLAVLQGITEFLPVSSSGHLALFQTLFRIPEQPVLFDIFLHLGTLFSIIVYFRHEISQLIVGIWKRQSQSIRVFLLIILATLPAVIVGFTLQKHIEAIFSSLRLIGISFIITAVILLATSRIKRGETKLEKMSWLDSLLIGLMQAVAILPGVSRSGSTISAGLFRKLEPKAAFLFSFYLSIPAIAGAFLLSILELRHGAPGQSLYLSQSLVGMVISAVVGYFAIGLLGKILANSKLYYFGFYCLALGLLVLLL